jgi:hypothetical protein
MQIEMVICTIGRKLKTFALINKVSIKTNSYTKSSRAKK